MSASFAGASGFAVTIPSEPASPPVPPLRREAAVAGGASRINTAADAILRAAAAVTLGEA